MGRMYTVTFSSVAVTAQQDLIAYVSPSTAITIIHGVEITQSTDVGDAQAEGLAILHKRGATTVGSGGATYTPGALEGGTTAAGGTARTNDTTKSTGGTIVTLHSSNWIIQSPYIFLPTPEMRHVLPPSTRYAVELATTPADSITMSGTLYLEEIG